MLLERERSGLAMLCLLLELQAWTSHAALVRGRATAALEAIPASKPTPLHGALDAGETCYDKIAHWRDLQGDSCLTYHTRGFCDRENGVFFGFKTVIMLLHRIGDDSPSDVCCYCGGGIIKECDATCRAVKQHEVSNVQYGFDAMSDEMRHEVAALGASTLTKVAQEMNASLGKAVQQLHQNSQMHLQEDLRTEEKNFEQLTEHTELEPSKAIAELEALAAKNVDEQLEKSLKNVDSTGLSNAGAEAELKLKEAQSAWDTAHRKAVEAKAQSNASNQEASERLATAMGRLARDFETVEDSRSNFTETQLEVHGAEEEVKLAAQIAAELRNKSQGVQLTLYSIKKSLSEEEAAAAGAANQTAGTTGDASLSPKEQLEDNEQHLRALESVVKQAEDVKA